MTSPVPPRVLFPPKIKLPKPATGHLKWFPMHRCVFVCVCIILYSKAWARRTDEDREQDLERGNLWNQLESRPQEAASFQFTLPYHT